MNPDSPYAKTTARERTRLEALLAARTNPDGSPRPGLRTNVAEIRRRLAKLPKGETNEPGV